MIESDIRADHKTGQVVWTMAPGIADFYAHELRRIQRNDRGIKDDADALNRCADELEEHDE